MKRGTNPKSLENLKKSPGRTAKYGQKKTREVSVSQEGWEGSLEVAKKAGCSGISELLEKLGRGSQELLDIKLIAILDKIPGDRTAHLDLAVREYFARHQIK